MIAFCLNPRCKSIFDVTDFFGSGIHIELTIQDVTYNPCPACGSDAKIPNGIYDIVNGVSHYVGSFKDDIRTLSNAKNLLEYSLRNRTPQKKVLNELSKISESIAAIAKNTAPKFELDKWIVVLLTLISLAISIQQAYFKKEEVTPSKFEEYLIKENEEYRKQIQAIGTNKSDRQRTNVKQISTPPRSSPVLNTPCPCGSKIPFILCHGRK